ncbi:hypothetical protein EWD71_20905 [Salmonella enterica subsp. enterica serovar Manhattan]|nr:hypothetical protein [Salmonella enterica subsp. enterica serovar Manhattan]
MVGYSPTGNKGAAQPVKRKQGAWVQVRRQNEPPVVMPEISTGHHNFMIGKEGNLCGNQQIKESLRGLQLMGVFCGLVSK